MPNWCENTLTVHGPKGDVKHFKDSLVRGDEGRYSLLDQFFPTPDSEKENWYEWCRNNWGTKWPDHLTLSDDFGGVLTYLGDTAWAPPIKGYQKVSELFPTLTFILTYSEEGCYFLGGVAIRAGEVLEEIEGDFPEIEMPDSDEGDTDTEEEWNSYYGDFAEATHETLAAIRIALLEEAGVA